MIRIVLLAAEVSANTQSWLDGLRGAGADVRLVTLHPLSPSLPGTHVVTAARRLGKTRYLFALKELRTLLQDLDPDLVIGYYVTSYGLMATLSWDGPLVIAAAGSDIVRATDIVRAQIVRFVLKRCDLVVTWAQHMSSALIRRGADSKRIMVLPRGIDTATFSSKGPVCRPASAFSVVWTRSLKPVYDPETAIRGFELSVRGGHDAHFTMLGHGPLAHHIETLTGELGIACRVTRLGVVSDASVVARHLRGADVYLSTAVSDGASASLFEAMACGAFPVVVDIPANREWITHGRNGLLFPPGDAGALAKALTSAFESAALRNAAVEVNTEMVQTRLDRSRNSAVMIEAFTRVARTDPLRAGRPGV
jgi:glycosyltransferase involved in cell wall biosynthesis